MITAKECLLFINEALKKYGTYNYADKGPDEVMDMPSIEKKMEDMSAKQLADLCAELRKSPFGELFVSCVLVDLQSRDDLDDLYTDDRLRGLY